MIPPRTASRHLILSTIAVLLFTASCTQPSRSLTVVTGKVVYGNMAMEGADLEAWIMDNGKWKTADVSRSGYHGSFRLHLAVGTYRIVATMTMGSGDSGRFMKGMTGPLEIKEGDRRIDQIVVEMRREQL